MPPVSAHLGRLGAQSRAAGSAGANEARAYCASVLGALGFAVKEHSFKYSAFTGRWATPAAGVVIPVLATVLFLAPATPAWRAGIGVVTLMVVAIGAYLGGPGVLDLPFLRRTGANLEAVRGSAEPTVWLVAHIDSKWQPVSMIVRVAGVIGVAIGAVSLFFALVTRSGLAPLALGLVWIGAVPLILSTVGSRNHGTLDNASGVAAVLEAAELIPPTARVGILITDAEELALAGARAWATTRTPVVALNCDSVDDDGDLVVMYSRQPPRALLSRLEQAALRHHEPLRTFRLIPGILTDHVALAEAGWLSVTLSRGTFRTLMRIHTSRDTLAAMDGRGIAGAARVLAHTATELG